MSAAASSSVTSHAASTSGPRQHSPANAWHGTSTSAAGKPASTEKDSIAARPVRDDEERAIRASHVKLGLAPPREAPSLQARTAAVLRDLAKVACGLGVVAGLSWGLAATGATAGMLWLFSGASMVDRVANSIYGIGPLLGVLMGVGGNMGFAHVDLIVYFVSNAWKKCSTPSWLLAHAAMASALSPLWLAAATPLTAPVLLGVAAGVGYLSWTIQRTRQQAAPPSFNHTLFALGVSLALAPIGAQAAAATSAIRIARQAVNFPLLAFGCIAIVNALRQLWTLFGSGAGGAEGSTPADTSNVLLFDGTNGGNATAYYPPDVTDAVQDLVVRARGDLQEKKNDGPRCYLLRAPHGAGKTTLACGIANALQTRMYKLERAFFEALGKGHSGQKLSQQMQQWGEQAQELGRPIVIYVPELTTLAPRAEEDDFVSQLKTLVANEAGGKARNLIFLFGTSTSVAKVRRVTDSAILNRTMRTLRWGPLAAPQIRQVLQVKLRQHLRASSIHDELTGPLIASGLDALITHVMTNEREALALRRHVTGSSVDAWATAAVDDTVSAYLRRRPSGLGPNEPSRDFPLDAELRRNLGLQMDARLNDRELGDDDGSESGSRPGTPRLPPERAGSVPAQAAPEQKTAGSAPPEAAPGGTGFLAQFASRSTSAAEATAPGSISASASK